MDRKDFISKTMRWGLFGLLAAMSVLLAARTTISTHDCNGCPKASSCNDTDNCTR